MLPGPYPWQVVRTSWGSEAEREEPSRPGSYSEEACSLVREPDSNQITTTINTQSQMGVLEGFSGQCPQPEHLTVSRGDLLSKTAAGDHSLQREGQVEPRLGGRR